MGGLLGGSPPKVKKAELVKPFTADQASEQYQSGQNNLQQQQAFLQQLQGQNALGNQTNVFGQQQDLANQLQQQAMGAGPNPALAQLNQATGANIAGQTAMMAGQRGAGQNAGLLARQAAQMGSANQQNAVGQAAVMQANQQLAAQQALMQQQQAMAQGAAQQAGQLQNQYGQLGQQTLQTQQNVFGGIANQNQAELGNVQQQNQANMQRYQANNQLMGSLLNAGASAAGFMMGGPAGAGAAAGATGTLQGGGGAAAMGGSTMMPMFEGGMVPVPSTVKGSRAAEYFKNGGMVQGQAKKAGDDIQNDTVPAMLSPGEIVVPRTVVQKGPDAARKFVEAVLAKQVKR